MKALLMALAAILCLSLPPLAWADGNQSDTRQKGQIRVEDLPKPIPELLHKIQQLSKKIEPEISRLGSRLGEELTITVKKLCDELKCQEHPETRPQEDAQRP